MNELARGAESAAPAHSPFRIVEGATALQRVLCVCCSCGPLQAWQLYSPDVIWNGEEAFLSSELSARGPWIALTTRKAGHGRKQGMVDARMSGGGIGLLQASDE